MPTPPYSWTYRRTFMFVVSAFCAAVILLALLVKPDAAVAGTAISFGFGTIGAIVGSYVFGAVWEDKNRKDNQ